MAVFLRYDLDTSSWERQLGAAAARATSLLPANRRAGEVILKAVTRNFATGGAHHDWKPLAASTLLNRARGRGGGGQVWKKRRSAAGERVMTAHASRLVADARPLVWSGKLLRSNTTQAAEDHVDVGTNHPGGARLYFGSAPGVRPVTPARNPLELLPPDEQEIERTYIEFWREVLG